VEDGPKVAPLKRFSTELETNVNRRPGSWCGTNTRTKEEVMLNAHLGTRRRLAALAGLLMTMALTAVPTAFAVPLMPDGEPVPRDSAPVVHTSSSGIDWGQVGLVVAGALVAMAITAAALSLTGRRRLRLAAR
jgi:hypothetical protein